MRSLIIFAVIVGAMASVNSLMIEAEAVKTKFPRMADLAAGKYLESNTSLHINAIDAAITIWTQYPMIVNMYRKHSGDIKVRLHFDQCNGANMCAIRFDQSTCTTDIIIEVIGGNYYYKIHYANCYLAYHYLIMMTIVATTLLLATCIMKPSKQPASEIPNDDRIDDHTAELPAGKEDHAIMTPVHQYPGLTAEVMKHSFVQMDPAQIV